MDFSDLFEGWDVSQFLSADELSLLNVVQQPASPLPSPPSSTCNSARQGPGSLEAQLSPAALPSIPNLAGLTPNTTTPKSNRNFFQQPRPSMPQPPQQYPTRPPPPPFAPQDPRMRPRPPFAHVRPVPPPQRSMQPYPQRPPAPPIFRTPPPSINSTPRVGAPPAGHGSFTARPGPASSRTPYQLAHSAPVYPAPTAPLSSAPSQRLSLADYRREKNLLQHPGVSSTPSSIQAPKRNSTEQEEGEIDGNETDESDQDEGPTSNSNANVSLDEGTKFTEPVTRQELVKRGLSVHFVPLPEGWVEIQHQSGMPVYCHLASRGVTWSRPYVCDKQERFRTHKAPISAFPCWDYQRALDEEEESQPEPVTTANQGIFEPEGFAEILSSLEFKEKSMMSADQIAKYCGKRFEFKTVTSSPAKSSRVKRASREALTQQLDKNETQAVVEKGLMVAFRRGETRFVLNAANRNPIALLQDFAFQNKKNQRISYECSPSLESNLLFRTDVLIDGKMEGSADGMSKKAAKQAAALDALRKLVPEIQHVLGETFGGTMPSGQVDEVALFRDVLIIDPRIGDTAVKAGVLPPYQILLRAVGNTDHDNVSLADKTKVCLSTRQIGPNRNEYTCVAGPYCASVVHTSLVRAKQLCAQQILQEIHPELATYGEFLELYGSAFQEKKKRLRQDAKCLYKLPPGPVVDEIDWPRIIQLQEEMRKLIPEIPGALSSLRYV